MPTPEQQARTVIDRLLEQAGWALQSVNAADIHTARGVAIREFPLDAGHGFADYLLYVDGKACGVIEAKKMGATLTGVEVQSARYAQGLPASLPAWRRPLPFVYESTGAETHFSNGLDPQPRARNVFAFHQPATLADWLQQAAAGPAGAPTTVLSTGTTPPPAEVQRPAATMLARLQAMPPLVTEWGEHKLWPAQITAIRNLEKSLAANKPRALIQMATGSGKTFTAISFIYRLIKYAGARRVLFLVDRGNLGRQTKKEFDQYVSPVNNFKSRDGTDRPDMAPAVPLPTGWQWLAVSEICGVVASGSTPKPEDMSAGTGEVPFIKVYNLCFEGELDFSIKPTFISRRTHEGQLGRSRCFPGDVLMNIVGPPLGKISVVPADHPEWNINQAVVTLRAGPRVLNRLLAYWLMSPPVQRRIEKTSKATAGQFNVQVSTCRKLVLPIPPLAEQHRIVAEVDRRLSIVREVEAEVDANLKRAQALRQAVLSRAFKPKDAS